MLLAVMLRSMELSLRSTRSVDVWVLDGGVSLRNKCKVERSLKTGRIRLRWVRVSRNLLRGCPLSGHVSLATYFRLLIPEVLPDNVSKVVYLDIDMLVLSDIGELYGLETGRAPVLAVRENETSTLGKYLRCCQEMGISEDAPYFNAGVLVMNLDVWRAENLSRRLVEFVNRHRDQVPCWDQDAMNALIAGRWIELPRTWNRTDAVWETFDLPEGAGSAAIIHFKGPIKPWHTGSTHGSIFFKYLDETAWKGWRPRRPIRNRHELSELLASTPLLGGLWRVSARTVMEACRRVAALEKRGQAR